ncbi:SDR family NAD(P)-dependent oxidoreductase [Nocardioides sp. 1609]|uniref:SDR family NAD(P)-dependent oxidoreductase n=1 Tax=Nocardioides sp. 1609 TaxID=2508327 RepID=UPI001ADC2115|nr:SDR family NAD(P)-dependent oxidoreductase [Nocardioides sp. 1609]
MTGGGRGLGRAHALALADASFAVVVNDTGAALDGTPVEDPGPDVASVAEQVVAEVRGRGGTAVADDSDVADPDGGERAVRRAVEEYGGLDAVVHSAGILRDRSFAKLTPADFDAVVRVHLGGTAHTTRAAWPHLRESGSGRVVLTSSAGGLFGQFGQAGYGAAKAGLLGLANVLRLEGERHGIGVNVIAPVATTRMTEPLLPSDVLTGLDPVHVAGVVAHLCREECRHSGLVLELAAGLAAAVRVTTSSTREVPRADDVAGMGRLLDELASLDDGRPFDDSPAALDRMLRFARGDRLPSS